MINEEHCHSIAQLVCDAVEEGDMEEAEAAWAYLADRVGCYNQAEDFLYDMADESIVAALFEHLADS